MKQRARLIHLGFSLLVSGVALLASVNVEAGSPPEHYIPPRLSDGKPNLQGVWTNASITTLERSSRYKELVIPRDQVAAATASHPQVVRLNTDDADDRDTQNLTGADLARGRGYNSFWIDPGNEFGLVKGERRTSWIVDPPNGRVPFSVAGRKMAEEFARQADNFDGPEILAPAIRCLIIGGRAGPPMINGLYNNNYQIVQTRDTVMIQVEMPRHVRIVRIGGKHLPKNVLELFGDSIGWWEGDTLVVETTNFHPLHRNSMVAVTSEGKITERFSRVSGSQLLYEFSVDDPAIYSQVWRGEMSFNKSRDHIFEYACHEGNYAMSGVLAGARKQEQPTAAAK
jgi:hypothetical protein